MDELQASHTAAGRQQGVGGGAPGHLTDAAQVSLLLGVLLQETKRKTSPRHQVGRVHMLADSTNTASGSVSGGAVGGGGGRGGSPRPPTPNGGSPAAPAEPAEGSAQCDR